MTLPLEPVDPREGFDSTDADSLWYTPLLDWPGGGTGSAQLTCAELVQHVGLTERPAEALLAAAGDLLGRLEQLPSDLGELPPTERRRWERLCDELLMRIAHRLAALAAGELDGDADDSDAASDSAGERPAAEFEPAWVDVLTELYRLGHARDWVPLQGVALQALAWGLSRASLRRLVGLLVELPPGDWSACGRGLSPLMLGNRWPVEAVFPTLLGAMHSPSTVAPILDLANYLTRRGEVAEHPCLPIAGPLTELLGEVAQRLGRLEEDPRAFGERPEEVERKLGESLALIVSLTDCVGLMGRPEGIGKLNQTLSLTHRRVQTEAAAALARLGDAEGKRRLLALAEDPAARQRAVAYARELGLERELDPQWTSPAATAEAQLASWLAAPQQMGLPPSELEQVDERLLYWPGHETPQNCFLFRYTYRFPGGTLSNLAFAGPAVHAFQADLADLGIDDVYAAFCGWHAEHEEMFELLPHQLNTWQREEADRLLAALRQDGFDIGNLLMMGFFLGQRSVVAPAKWQEADGVVVSDGLDPLWLPLRGNSLGDFWPCVYYIFKGRQIIRVFNP